MVEQCIKEMHSTVYSKTTTHIIMVGQCMMVMHTTVHLLKTMQMMGVKQCVGVKLLYANLVEIHIIKQILLILQ